MLFPGHPQVPIDFYCNIITYTEIKLQTKKCDKALAKIKDPEREEFC